jgi:hypothetical protein
MLGLFPVFLQRVGVNPEDRNWKICRNFGKRLNIRPRLIPKDEATRTPSTAQCRDAIGVIITVQSLLARHYLLRDNVAEQLIIWIDYSSRFPLVLCCRLPCNHRDYKCAITPHTSNHLLKDHIVTHMPIARQRLHSIPEVTISTIEGQPLLGNGSINTHSWQQKTVFSVGSMARNYKIAQSEELQD